MAPVTDAERKFKRLAEFPQLVRVADAAFEPRMTGGFEKLMLSKQGAWPALNERWRKTKLRKGWSILAWERTGRTLAALSQGRFNKLGTRRGVRFKMTRKGIFEVRAMGFGPAKGRKPSAKQQERIFGALNWGDGGRWKPRTLFEWEPSEQPEIEKAVEAELRKLVAEEGLL